MGVAVAVEATMVAGEVHEVALQDRTVQVAADLPSSVRFNLNHPSISGVSFMATALLLSSQNERQPCIQISVVATFSFSDPPTHNFHIILGSYSIKCILWCPCRSCNKTCYKVIFMFGIDD